MPSVDDMLERARAGDRASIEWLLREYQPDVRRFAKRACRNVEDAEDAVQHTLFQLSRGVGALRGGARVTTWLFTVVKNECSRLLSRMFRERAKQEYACISAATSDSELRLALEQAIASLDTELREVFVMRDIEELTGPEVSTRLGISLEAMKSRLHRARLQLRSQLETHAEL